jgi:hypothetical protein
MKRLLFINLENNMHLYTSLIYQNPSTTLRVTVRLSEVEVCFLIPV